MYLKRKRNYSINDLLLLLLICIVGALLIISYAPIFNTSSQIESRAYARVVESANGSATSSAIARNIARVRPRSVESAGYNVMVNVWEDLNGDGRRTADEPGLSNMEVEVMMDGSSCMFSQEISFGQCVGIPTYAVLTDENGQAILPKLAPPPAATGTTQIWVQMRDMSEQYVVTYNSSGKDEYTYSLPWPSIPSGIYDAAENGSRNTYVPQRISWGLQKR